jgi:hypothetical protein
VSPSSRTAGTFLLLLLWGCGLTKGGEGGGASGTGQSSPTHVQVGTTEQVVGQIPLALDVERRLTVLLFEIKAQLQRMEDMLKAGRR